MQNTIPKTSPAPWIVLEPYTNRAVYPIAYRRHHCEAYTIIAEVNSQGGGAEECKANAVLIASAPELLSIATELLGQLSGLATQVKAAGLLVPPNVTKAIQRAREAL